MSSWFHRNPLKSTTLINFDLKMVVANAEAIQICSEMKESRRKLLDALCDPGKDITIVDGLVISYLSLLMGFVKAQDSRGGDSSKLRHCIKFKWTQSVLGTTPIVQQDAIFELISICQEYGLWLMKHASFLAGRENLGAAELKSIHSCLRQAAGIFKSVGEEYTSRLLEKPAPGSDMDPKVTTAYVLQCTGEAQEVTIARAIELKHAASLISGLAAETSKTFLSAASAIKTLDIIKFGKWMLYFLFKSAFYESYAYIYLAENLLSLDKCGEAVRAAQHSEKLFETAENLCKEFVKTKGAGNTVDLEQHQFYRQLRTSVKRIKEKCERENGLIYHQRVATDIPPMDFKASHGLVTPVDFKLPELSPRWTPSAYAAFDLSKAISQKNESKPSKETLPPMEEKPHESSNSNSCMIQ